ncbi:MAG: tetratricopeptide repeat protein [Anaerolineales bacterium]|nr:tetratricopeptide repeat protein [Anaerolineales bacterium]
MDSHELANSYSLSGQPRRAVPLNLRNAEYDEKHGRKEHLAVGLGNLANKQLVIGALNAAERNLRRQIDLCREITDEFSEAIAHQELGHALSYRGAWQEAETIHERGIELARKRNNKQIECVNYASYSAYGILMKKYSRAIEKGMNSKGQLADDSQAYYHATDYVRAYWLLGAAYRANNELTLAEENLSKALNLCRQINLVDAEADILLDLARLRYAQGDFKDAQEKASEALVITERSGYVLQGADVNLFLAQYALEQEKDKVKAKAYAESALKLAYCDGPPYYYRVAYEEAEAMLEKLSREL